jgi:hypothetical protein
MRGAIKYSKMDRIVEGSGASDKISKSALGMRSIPSTPYRGTWLDDKEHWGFSPHCFEYVYLIVFPFSVKAICLQVTTSPLKRLHGPHGSATFSGECGGGHRIFEYPKWLNRKQQYKGRIATG